MKRLMRRSTVGEGLPVNHIHIMHMSPDSEENLTEVFERLTEYEDTGLSPEEINNLNTFDGSQGMKYLKLYQEEQQKHRWIPVSERLLEEAEYLGISDGQRYMKRIEVAYMTDTIEYMIGYFDGYKWMDKKHNRINNVVAWKTHEPYIP